MKRPLLTLLLAFVLGLQGPLVAYASTVADASAVGCGLATENAGAASGAQSQATPDSCCPGGAPAANCCFTLCLASTGATQFPVFIHWYSPAVLPFLPQALAFSSRGDAPLIRPPIL